MLGGWTGLRCRWSDQVKVMPTAGAVGKYHRGHCGQVPRWASTRVGKYHPWLSCSPQLTCCVPLYPSVHWNTLVWYYTSICCAQCSACPTTAAVPEWQAPPVVPINLLVISLSLVFPTYVSAPFVIEGLGRRMRWEALLYQDTPFVFQNNFLNNYIIWSKLPMGKNNCELWYPWEQL